MLSALLLVLAVGFQLFAAALALRILRASGFRTAWAMLTAAVTLMVVDGMIALFAWTAEGSDALKLSAEVLALAVSILTVIGIGLLQPRPGNARTAEPTRPLNDEFGYRRDEYDLRLRETDEALHRERDSSRQAAQRLDTEHTTTHVLSESATLEEAASKILQATCERLDWDVGELWSADSENGMLRRRFSWMSPAVDGETFPADRECGLAGRVWTNGRPEWVSDIARDETCPRMTAAAEAGLHAACGFPVLSGSEVRGVMVLLSQEVSPPDEDVLMTLNNIGGQLAQFIERRQAQQALLESERAMATLVGNLPGMVYRCRNTESRTVELAGPGCLDLTGYTPQDLIESRPNLGALTHPEDRQQVWETVQQALERNERFQLTYRMFTASGKLKWIWEQGIGIVDDEGRVVALEGFITDISDRKQLEEQFHQAQKMEAVGRLAGGVAHDFNNMLTVINGYSDLLLEGLSAEDPHREMADSIRDAGQRAAALTRQLLTVSRKEVAEPQVLDVNVLITKMEKILRRLIGEDIALETSLEPDLGHVYADHAQLEQVVLNLAVNARDAMPQGGKLTLETDNVDLDRSCMEAHWTIEAGRYVQLAVSDTGCGMDEATRSHIFEPFFTTKQDDQGTGLGLATVFGIVRQIGGRVGVSSEPGVGTTIRVHLPHADAEPSALAAPETEIDVQAGRETVLLVEDEAHVRTLARHVLEGAGYTVLEAADGAQGLAMAEESAEAIDLLLTDVVMPGMSGRQLAERLAPQRPGMKTLYMSGYTDDSVIRHGILETEMAFLQKPFTPTGLTGTVREVLDGGPGRRSPAAASRSPRCPG